MATQFARDGADRHDATGSPDRSSAHSPSPDVVWRALKEASFAIVSHVTPGGEPRSSGVVYGIADGRVYFAVAPQSWKAREISDGQRVAVTVPVRRGGLLSLLLPIPPATVSFHAQAIVHPPNTIDLGAVSKKLESLVPKERRAATVIELIPEGSFLTYGIGVSLWDMRHPAAALAHVPLT
jgi:hypothetical protein